MKSSLKIKCSPIHSATNMKKIILLPLLFVSMTSFGCDVCGCSLGGNYYGILPQFNKNFVGLRYSRAQFHASMFHDSQTLSHEHSDDTYSKVELFGRYYINKKLQAFLFVPYNFNEMNGTEQVISKHGLGDITASANYLLLNTGNDSKKKFRHTLMMGGGIKLPTGNNSLRDKNKLVNPNFQMGTGSVDFLLSAVYTLRYQKIGFNNEAGYKLNTRNKDDYRFGNQFYASSRIFYWQNAGAFSFLPNAGIYYEQAATHLDGDIIKVNTGGSGVLAVAGLETYVKQFSLGFNYKHPLAQTYNSDETATITGSDRWMISLTYNF